MVRDMRMLGMTGLELYQELVASSRGIPTVIITAHPEELTQARTRSRNHLLSHQAVRTGRAFRVRLRVVRQVAAAARYTKVLSDCPARQSLNANAQ
jgi:CheY-like chemotaxis protein